MTTPTTLTRTNNQGSNEIKLYSIDQNLANIPSRDFEIQKALNSRLFSEISDKEAYEIVKSNVVQCYIAARYTSPEAAELKIIVNETMKVVKYKMGSLRENEMPIAFTRGMIGDYGEYKGLSFITFTNFIKGYMKELSRISLTNVTQIKHEPTVEELYQIKKINALSALKEFLKNGTVGRFGEVVYSFLVEIRQIDLSTPEKKEWFAMAEEAYRINPTKSQGVILDQIEKLKVEKDRIISLSKTMIVDDYMKTIVFDDTDFDKLIDENKPQQ